MKRRSSHAFGYIFGPCRLSASACDKNSANTNCQKKSRKTHLLRNKFEEKILLDFIHNSRCLGSQSKLISWRERIVFESLREIFKVKMQSIQLVLLALVSLLCAATGQNYCDNSLCHGRQHVGCRNSGVRAWMLLNYADKHYILPSFVQLFYNSCPSDRHLVRLSKEQKQTILNTHNFFRWLFDVQTRNSANIWLIISCGV